MNHINRSIHSKCSILANIITNGICDTQLWKSAVMISLATAMSCYDKRDDRRRFSLITFQFMNLCSIHYIFFWAVCHVCNITLIIIYDYNM